MKRFMIAVLGVALTCCGWASVQASITNITEYPAPWAFDETAPRGALGTAPFGWGDSSWQGPVAGSGNKTNYYVPTTLTGSSLTPVGDLTSLSYWTMRDATTLATGRNWFVQIYTTPTGTDDNASWYHSKYIGDTVTSALADVWAQWFPDFTKFNKVGGVDTLSGPTGTLGAVAAGETILYISLQTASPWNGFDGYVDGLSFTLSGDTVNVNLAAVPEPATILVWSLLGLAAAGFGVWRQKQTA